MRVGQDFAKPRILVLFGVRAPGPALPHEGPQLADQIGLCQQPVAGDAVRQQLRANTDEALALGLFGVPSLVVDGRVFWGFDALPMVAAWLAGHEWFAPGGAWDQAASLPAAVQRPR